VLNVLKTEGLAENTLVIFTSDNGAVLHADALAAGHRANSILLGQKTDAWEGGHRVPFIARWPSVIPAGTQCNRMLCLVDLMATIAAAVRVPLPAGAAPDGLNQLRTITNPENAPVIRTEMIAQGTGGYAIRQGDWVYLPKQGSCGMTVQVPSGIQWGQPYSSLGLTNSDVDPQGKIKPGAPPAQLYNLRTDFRQTTNLFYAEPGTAKRLADRLKEILNMP
jgi:arylsulfatase A-like enzyme